MNPLQIRIQNNLTARKEIFQPLEEGKVKMYVCGITPYDECHLGHARCYVFFDTIRRFFRACGLEVTYVQNFTDIDDKIIARAKILNRTSASVADEYIEDYYHKMKLLNIQPASVYPRVTDTIPQIIAFVQKLIVEGFAYVLEGDVYYSVRKFSRYGKLSKRTLDEMESGARVEVNESKRDPLDFALWKKAKSGEPSWDSPWGSGRPGWHIECSVMAIQHLGETFDIHGGGQDLIFPHHENEIAQSEAVTGKPFARGWIHNGFVTINREKMSKSLGNFFSLREIFEKYSPEVVRFFLLSRHYRSPLDFSDDLLIQSQRAYASIQGTFEMAHFLLDGGSRESAPLLPEWENRFLDAMSDDLNTEKAIAVLFQLRGAMDDKMFHGELEWVRKACRTLSYFCNELLGVRLEAALKMDQIRAIKKELAQREEYRKKKDWVRADELRRAIESRGFSIEDTPAGALIKSKE